MLDAIAEVPPVAWPLALSFATVVAAERVRARRRRELLNRSLHELRRPLQALVLQARNAVARWRAAAALSGRRIEFSWAAPGARLDCDPLALSRALDNLLANAIE